MLLFNLYLLREMFRYCKSLNMIKCDDFLLLFYLFLEPLDMVAYLISCFNIAMGSDINKAPYLIFDGLSLKLLEHGVESLIVK